MASDVHRPDPLRWIMYAFGAGLPERNRTWVLHDVTAPTWVLRHLVRSIVQIVPFAVVLYFVLPFPPVVVVSAIVMGSVIGILYSAAFVEAAVEHRAIKAGYPEGHAAAVRHERHRQHRRR
jgi:hypothetical protein